MVRRSAMACGPGHSVHQVRALDVLQHRAPWRYFAGGKSCDGRHRCGGAGGGGQPYRPRHRRKGRYYSPRCRWRARGAGGSPVGALPPRGRPPWRAPRLEAGLCERICGLPTKTGGLSGSAGRRFVHEAHRGAIATARAVAASRREGRAQRRGMPEVRSMKVRTAARASLARSRQPQTAGLSTARRPRETKPSALVVPIGSYIETDTRSRNLLAAGPRLQPMTSSANTSEVSY
jgi:hypothetical protein